MNKKELINEIDKINAFAIYGKTTTKEQAFAVGTAVGKALELVKKLDEPEKVKIPQFVAEKIEYCKANSGYSLFHAMDYCFQFIDSADWLECNQDLFARAWLDGYTIEQEKLYTVEIPNPNWKHSKGWVTGLVKTADGIVICQTNNPSQLTESEIRKDFDWAWNEEFVKEVE